MIEISVGLAALGGAGYAGYTAIRDIWRKSGYKLKYRIQATQTDDGTSFTEVHIGLMSQKPGRSHQIAYYRH